MSREVKSLGDKLPYWMARITVLSLAAMIAIGVWVVCSFLVGLVARALGRFGTGWAIFSMMFSPSLGLLLVAILDKKGPRPHRPLLRRVLKTTPQLSIS